jgi:hypothetical protein
MRTSTTRPLLGSSALLLSLSLLGAVACGEPPEDFETNSSAITGGWTTLTLKNGWTAQGGTTPAVGIVNGVVTFRGALTAPANQTNPVAFELTDSRFQPFALNIVQTRVVLSGNVGGTLYYNPFSLGNNIPHSVSIFQDGVSPPGLGAEARTFVSLDGVAFDKSPGQFIENDPAWKSLYGHRQSESGCPGDCGAYVKLVDGMVRFQGFLQGDPNNLNGYLFTLPDAKYIPGNDVTIPVDLGGEGVSQAFGALYMYPNGQVWVYGDPYAAARGVSFEGAWYSKTLSGNIALPLNTNGGWHAYSARSVKVGKYGDVVRLQGGIAGNGSSSTLATLPVGYRPSKTVKVHAVTYGSLPGTITINTSGVMTISGPPLGQSTLFVSLDGVSFGL